MQFDYTGGRRRGHTFLSLLLASVAFGAACTSELDLTSDELGSAGLSLLRNGDNCPEWGCGVNTAVINDTVVGELNFHGLRGDGGFRVLSFQHVLGLPLQLEVRNGEFIGHGLLGMTFRGADLIGSRLVLENLAELSVHAIIITDFGYVPSWTQPVTQVPAYHLLSTTIGLDLGDTLFAEVCGAAISSGGLTPLASHYAVLVNGERYDPISKTVTASGSNANGWFNIACNGSALAKMKLLGYDPEFTNTAATAATTPAQRQATLKMITADYCGTGTSFTEVGEPVRWYNRTGRVVPGPDVAPAESPEAIWTANGVLCLDIPRLAGHAPEIVDAIDAECGAALQPCDGLLATWSQVGEWRTENPIQP